MFTWLKETKGSPEVCALLGASCALSSAYAPDIASTKSSGNPGLDVESDIPVISAYAMGSGSARAVFPFHFRQAQIVRGVDVQKPVRCWNTFWMRNPPGVGKELVRNYVNRVFQASGGNFK